MLSLLDAPTIDTPRAAAAVLGGRYELGALIARGGMGEVFEGWDRERSRAVAVKRLAPRLCGDPELRARFRREAEALAGLSHPHIVAVYGVGEDDGAPYFVMERLRGHTLADEVRARGPRPTALVARWGRELASALEMVHHAGFVHRDVKPSNVMITAEGRAVLLDFGVLRSDDSHVTHTGTVVGTPEYMAPEQARDARQADARSDLYALGATLYAAWVGAPPFAGASSYELIHAHHTQAPPAPSVRVPGLSSAVDAWVARAMAKAPGDRFTDAAALRASLEALERAPAGRGRARVVAAVGAASVAVIALVWATQGTPRTPTRAPRPGAPSEAANAGVSPTVSGSAVAPAAPAASPPSTTLAPVPAASKPASVPASAPPVQRASPKPATLRVVTRDRGLVTYATIIIDDRPPIAAPVAALVLPAGDHALRVERAGYHPQTIRFSLAPDEKRKLDIELERAPAPAEPSATP